MKTLVIYDSLYGNTQKVAQAIAEVTSAKCINVAKLKPSDLEKYELLIVGSPTQGGRPTQAVQDFFAKVSANSLKGIRTATFDTRIDIATQQNWLKIVMKMLNFAAPRLAKILKTKGAKIYDDQAGFIVEGKEGPLRTGELKRAKVWAEALIKSK